MSRYKLENATPVFFNEKTSEKEISEKRLIKLTRNYYFDRLTKYIIKRVGNDFGFVADNRRTSQKPVDRERRQSTEPVDVHPKPISQGLYWDPDGKKVYKKVRGKFILYSKDRRVA